MTNEERNNAISDLMGDFDPFKTIYLFNNNYHAVVNGWLTEIPSNEAENNLRSPEYSLWLLRSEGTPEIKPPESCPSWIYTTIDIKGPAESFLQHAFNIYYELNKNKN